MKWVDKIRKALTRVVETDREFLWKIDKAIEGLPDSPGRGAVLEKMVVLADSHYQLRHGVMELLEAAQEGNEPRFRNALGLPQAMGLDLEASYAVRHDELPVIPLDRVTEGDDAYTVAAKTMVNFANKIVTDGAFKESIRKDNPRAGRRI